MAENSVSQSGSQRLVTREAASLKVYAALITVIALAAVVVLASQSHWAVIALIFTAATAYGTYAALKPRFDAYDVLAMNVKLKDSLYRHNGMVTDPFHIRAIPLIPDKYMYHYFGKVTLGQKTDGTYVWRGPLGAIVDMRTRTVHGIAHWTPARALKELAQLRPYEIYSRLAAEQATLPAKTQALAVMQGLSMEET